MKRFIYYFLLTGGLFLVLGFPVYGIFYLLSPAHGGIIWGHFIGSALGCGTVNGIFYAIAGRQTK